LINSLFDDQIPQEIDKKTGLAVGPLVSDPSPARMPARQVLQGRYCTLEPLELNRHLADLYTAKTQKDAAARFRYLPENPPATESEFATWLTTAVASNDPLYFAVIDNRTGRAAGRQTLMRMQPDQQSIEIGHIFWGPNIAGTRVTTEANYLFARYAFDELGYRRYEWKCDALNQPSRRAALRFGFRFEGHFRRAALVNGHTRDTTWYSIIKEEWSELRAILETWLAEENFSDNGTQKSRLSDLTAAR